MNEEVLTSAQAEDRIRVTYILTCAAGEDAEAKARDIALEQTVELPAECVAADIERRIVGTVEHLEAVDRPPSRWGHRGAPSAPLCRREAAGPASVGAGRPLFPPGACRRRHHQG